MVKIFIWCIFYVGVASALMLCERLISIVMHFLGWGSRSSEGDRAPDTAETSVQQKVQTVIELDFNESEALFLSFLLPLFLPSFLPSLITLQWLAQAPPPQTPSSLTRRGGGACVLSVEGEFSVFAIISPRRRPHRSSNRGKREGDGDGV